MRKMTCILLLAFAFPAHAASCPGDCNHDRTTAIDELVMSVSIALGRTNLEECSALDVAGDGSADIGDLVAAVATALDGCPAPVFQPAKCEVPLPDGQDAAHVECGSLTVPEDRDRPSGRAIELAVAILHSTAASPEPDPLVMLSGGPGDAALAGVLPRLTGDFAAPIQSRRDIVVFDQRGTGFSHPALDCPEVLGSTEEFAELLSPEDEAERDAADIIACRDRLIAEGNDLSTYSSAATALDIVDVMAALGYEQWNLYGLSYGTRVALTALRDVPNRRIRSAVLDSVVPLQSIAQGAGPPSLQRSFDVLFAACAADPGCDGAFPDLRQTVFDLYDRLNAAPLTLQPSAPDGQPFTVVVTGDRLFRLAGNAFQNADLIPYIPIFAATTAAGNTTLLSIALSQLGAPAFYSPGLAFAVLCNEELPFDTAAALADADQGVAPTLIASYSANPYRGETLRRACAEMGHPPRAIENEPVSSQVPALILAGEYDTATPPAFGRLAQSTLPNSYFFQFPGFGHVELFEQAAPTGPPACAMRIMAQFLDDPTHEPDGSCIAAIGQLHFPGT